MLETANGGFWVRPLDNIENSHIVATIVHVYVTFTTNFPKTDLPVEGKPTFYVLLLQRYNDVVNLKIPDASGVIFWRTRHHLER